MLECMKALHSKAVKSQSTARESFCGSFASFVHPLYTLIMQEVAAVSRSINNFGCKELIELCGKYEYEAAAKGLFCRLGGGALVSSRTSASIPEAGGTGATSRAIQLR